MNVRLCDLRLCDIDRKRRAGARPLNAMLVISHRGLRGDGFDNTLDAFQRAVDLGVDGIETDIRLSADGQLILYHDRLSPDGRNVSELSRRELSGLTGHAVPTLDDALAAWDELLWVLDVKSPAVLEHGVDVLRQYHNSRRCLAISFWHPVIERIRSELEMECGWSMRHRPLSGVPTELEHLPDDPRMKTAVWDYEFLDADLVRGAKSRGWRNLVFGPTTAADHRHCTDLGLDGVITDFPHYLLHHDVGPTA